MDPLSYCPPRLTYLSPALLLHDSYLLLLSTKSTLLSTVFVPFLNGTWVPSGHFYESRTSPHLLQENQREESSKQVKPSKENFSHLNLTSFHVKSYNYCKLKHFTWIPTRCV